MKLIVTNNSGYPLEYKRVGDSGMDLRACISEPITLGPLERAIIPTGITPFLDLGQVEIQVRPRSGLAANHGITVLNSPGTVDSNYTGEIKVILVNLSKDPYTVTPGERIAQLVVAKVETVTEVCEVSEDPHEEKSERGDSGFGSSGKF